jgi:hypothetical protein
MENFSEISIRTDNLFFYIEKKKLLGHNKERSIIGRSYGHSRQKAY